MRSIWTLGQLSFFHNAADWVFVTPTDARTDRGIDEARLSVDGAIVPLRDLHASYLQIGLFADLLRGAGPK